MNTTSPISTATVTTSYRVEGMTCGHCVMAVNQEIKAIDGVCGVEVDLDTGRVTVSSERDLDREAVAAAVDEAGYRLA